MYKFTTEDNTYSNYKVINTLSQELVSIEINPFELKLFNNDLFDLPNLIVYSNVRLCKYNAGILLLNKTVPIDVIDNIDVIDDDDDDNDDDVIFSVLI